MNKLFVALSLSALLTGGLVFAAELTSGLPVGEELPPFAVRDVTGPAKGTTLCYRCRYQDQPVVAIFSRDLNEHVKDLIKKVDAAVGKNEEKKMAAFVVMLTSKPAATERQLEALAKEEKITNTPLTFVEGETGPEDYRIAREAEVTVMMWVNGKVKVNHAYAKGKLEKKEVDSLVAETREILE